MLCRVGHLSHTMHVLKKCHLVVSQATWVSHIMPLKEASYVRVLVGISVAVSCGYGTCFVISACDGLCHLTKVIDRVGTPFGFQPIMSTFVRHTCIQIIVSIT